MKKEWLIKKVAEPSVSILEQLLEIRGITKHEDIREFLNPLEFNLISPFAFCDMKTAIERITKAISDNEKILIYGDFDADGITSTSVLIKTFRYLNADVDYFIPEREKYGHGLNLSALIKVIAKRKPKLIITVDNGISNIKEVQQLKAFGIDTIITDHHESKDEMPDAVAIINPKAPFKIDENLTTKQIVSLTSLAGVGVAFKLAVALLNEYSKSEFVLELLPLVAVGTISDLVPLVYENRYLVIKGLELLGNHYGLTKIATSAGCSLEDEVTSEQVAFGITPRINATGRLGTVQDSVNVLISENKSEIDLAVISLENCNSIRQELCENMFAEAKVMPQNKNSIILFNKDWHVGIIGIVASKMVETYNKPAFLMTYCEEKNQMRCSARGIAGVNVFDVLSANEDLFENFGGHTMAGGFSFSLDKHSFEEVKTAIDTTINEMLEGKTLNPVIDVDLELNPELINFDLIQDIQKLQPFGADNSNPVFVVRNMKLLQKKLMGSKKNHLKLLVTDDKNNTYTCVWWSRGDISLVEGDYLDIAFEPKLNVYNGSTSLQLIIVDVHSQNLKDDTQNFQYTIYDHRKKIGIFNSIEDYLKTTKLNIGVFVENPSILEIIKPYPQIFNRVFSRLDTKEYNAIMFFDYPASSEIFEDIIKTTRIFHFMKYDCINLDEQIYLKNIAGMIRYSVNHYNGIFNINNASSKLALTNDVIIETLNALESVQVIDIKERSDSKYEIILLNSNFERILHSELYSEVLTQLKIIDDFKASFATADLNYFCNVS